ncbi:MAG: hypothetical protein AMXMBFR64_45090 [Myxococcales bacterium]
MRQPATLFALSLSLALAAGCAASCGALGDLHEVPLEPAPAADVPLPDVAPLAAPLGADPAPEPPAPPSACGAPLLVTELMIDPRATADNRGEYFELHNPGEHDVDLRGFRLDDGRHAPETFAGDAPLLLTAGGFAVIAPSEDVDANGGLTPLIVTRTFALPNEAGLVRITDPCGAVVVRVRYDTRAPWPRGKAGFALELVGPTADPSRPQSWRRASQRAASGDRGTPGWATWAKGSAAAAARSAAP